MKSKFAILIAISFISGSVYAACKPGECGAWGQPAKPGEGGNDRGNSSGSAASDAWGAIAVSNTTLNGGTSNGMASYDEAAEAAIATCGGGDCTVVAWEENFCTALAIEINVPKGKAKAAANGSGATSSQATKQAVRVCQSHGAKCKVAANVCY